MTRAILPRVARTLLHCCLATLSLLSVAGASAASNPTDISQTPLVVTNSAQIKPNIMLLMDNSGSMGRTHMPDEVESVAGVKSIGYKSSQCNALYFNPDTPYALPKKYDGTLFTKPTFGAAAYAGYVSFFVAPDSKDSSTSNLNTDFVPYDWGKNTVLGPLGAPTAGPSAGFAAATPGPAYYYVYTDALGAKPASLAYSSSQCKQLDTGATIAATGGGTWTRYNVALRPAAEQDNFALWYSFYRTRLSLTKSAASLAFAALNSSKRVGFITVEPKVNPSDAEIDQARYLPIGDFTTTASGQKDLWYQKLFSQVPSGASPAREGLARVGRYYGGKTDGINKGMGGPDPVQYACQQNFTIMTTDGYWNGQTQTPVTGGGIKLEVSDGLVGQQDGETTCSNTDPKCARPIFDGNSASIQKDTDKYNTYSTQNCTIDTLYRHREQLQRQTYRISRDTSRTTQTTTQFTKTTSQLMAKTEQTVMSTTQNKRTTEQYYIETIVPVKRSWQVMRYDDKILRDTEQYTRQQLQQMMQTVQNTEVVTQNYLHGDQWSVESKQFVIKSTQFQLTFTTFKQGRQQRYKRQWQWLGSSAAGEISAPLADSGTCPNGYTCQQYDSFSNQLVDPADCVSSNVSGYNSDPTKSYVHTECTDGSQATAYGPVAACDAGVTPGTPTTPNSGNNFVKTTCDQSNSTVYASTETNASGLYSLTNCPASSQSGSSPYTITKCNVTMNSDAAIASCTPGSPVVGSGSSYIWTQCYQPSGTNKTTVTPQCDENAGWQTGSNFIQTRCFKSWTYDAPFNPADPWCANAYYYADSLGAGAGWYKGSCGYRPVSSGLRSISASAPGGPCVVAGPSGGNSWKNTTCTPLGYGSFPNATLVQYGTCVAGPNTGAYVYDTLCTPGPSNQSSPIAVKAADCGGAASYTTATSSPWMDVACVKPPANNQTAVPWNPATTCPSSDGLSSPYIKSTCTTVNTFALAPVQSGTCNSTTTSTSSPFTIQHCYDQELAATFTCPGAGVATSSPWINETCTQTPQPDVNVAYGSCTPGAALNATQTCRSKFTENQLPVTSCTEVLAPTGTNPKVTCTGWVTVPALSGPVAPSSCPATQGQQGGATNYVVTCTGPTAFGTYATPAGVPSCPSGSTLTTPAVDPTTKVVTTCYQPAATNTVSYAICDPVADSHGPDGNYISVSCVKSGGPQFQSATVCAANARAYGANGPQITCSTVAGDSDVGVATCTQGATDAFSPFDTVTNCYSTKGTAPWVNDGSACTPGPTMPAGQQYDCRSVPSGLDVADPACSPSGPDGSGLVISCSHIYGTGYKYRFFTTTKITTTPVSGGQPSGPGVDDVQAGATSDVNATCYATAQTTPSLPDFPAAPLVGISGCTPVNSGSLWPCRVTTPGTGSSLNSLADVAQYYYVTDLRPLMDNVVPKAGGSSVEDDTATWQHMTTFTLALGVSGTLNYQANYRETTTVVGDFADIRTGKKNWPEWPDKNLDYNVASNYDNPKSIDDFWHTAVNGRGRFFSANDPKAVVQGLGDALAKAGQVNASGAADSVSTLSPVNGNNFVYGTSYESKTWSGEMEAFTLDVTTGAVNLPAAWSAKALLNGRVFPTCDNRRIYLMRNGSSLVDFAWNTDECPATGTPTGTPIAGTLNTAEKANFSKANIASLSQFTAFAPTDPQLVAAQADGALVNYLRGQTSHEDWTENDTTKFFRKRGGALGDLVDSQPVYVKVPFADYVDAGYADFKLNKAGRDAMVYVGGNDGMVHAFNGSVDTSNLQRGQEVWSVIPSEVLPKLYTLADTNYSLGNHQFFVDGSPVASDVYDGTNWHTILVGGLNAGGKGYYALDVTTPGSPAALWEFRRDAAQCPDKAPAAMLTNVTGDCNMGLSFGKPVVTKLGAQWVVMFTSGYNNLNGAPKGEGEGFLYVVDALTGKLIHKIGTGAGDGTTPSGLAQINNYVDNVLFNNSTLRAYGGDLLGNIFRFEFGSTPKAVLLGKAESGGTPQPITTRPELAELNGLPFVVVGTGKLLGDTDVAITATQSVYGIADHTTSSPSLPTPEYASLRGALRNMKMTQVGLGVTALRTVDCDSNCTKADGWVVDLGEAGERVNVDMKLVLGTLVFASNVPQAIPCSIGGHSWLNQLDFRTGAAVTTAPLTGSSGIISNYLADSLNVGINVLQFPPLPGKNNGVYKTIAKQSDGSRVTKDTYIAPPPFVGKRISWREVVQ